MLNPSAIPSARTGMVALTASFVLAVGLFTPARAGEQMKLPAGAKPLSAAEMYEIFRDKTWQWGQGGARFLAENRRFIAVIEEKEGQKIGEGRYRLFNDGQMCIEAIWISKQDSSPARTCFWHYKDRGTIYQAKKDGEAGWYIFRHYKENQNDEFEKLTEVDSLTEKFASLKKQLAPEEGDQNGG